MKYIKYFKESSDFDRDWIKLYITHNGMRPGEDRWSSIFDNLSKRFKTFRYLPNGLWEVTKDIDIQMTSLRSVSFKVGYFLCTYEGKIYYSWDRGKTWKQSYDLDFNVELSHTVIGDLERIYMTYYRSVKKSIDYDVISNTRKNKPQVYSLLEKMYDKKELEKSAGMGEMGFND